MIRPTPHPRKTTTAPGAVIALSACMALQMTSAVMIFPLFARRFQAFGAGVEALGLSAMAYALAATAAAPFLGTLADRFGRRPLVLGSLAAYAMAYAGFLSTESATAFIVLRGLAGGFTAGLIPAVMGTVGDIAPADRRAQYVGIVNGGASIGWIAGPILGGTLFDRWGYLVPFGAAAGIALIALVVAYFAVPETQPARASGKAVWSGAGGAVRSWTALASGRWRAFIALLLIALGVMFAWAFIEPQLMFYAYDDLGWTSSRLGTVISIYGLAVGIGEFTLGRASDRWGRRPILVLGLLLFSAQFGGLVLTTSPGWIAASFVVAGLGNALFDPALNACFLELAPAANRGRVMGLKSTAGSLGSMLGPALVVMLAPQVVPRAIFTISLVLVFCLVAAAATALPAGSGRGGGQGQRGECGGRAERGGEEDDVGVPQRAE